MFALEFPPINEVIRWKDVFSSFNKVGIIACLASLIGITIFLIAGRKDPMVAPKGVRNVAETGVEFIENQIVMQTIGEDGLGWTPFLLTLFVFIYLCNLPGIIPILQFPATARMALPLFMSVIVWLIYNGVGFKHQGLGYLKSSLFPPGVPKAMYLLVTPIEFISTFIVRPFSLAIRLFANMLAGHMLLVTFALLSNAMLFAETKQYMLKPMTILPVFMLVFLTTFEVLVGFLQAFIFTILTGVYIGQAKHPAH
ncbi:MAG: F0F1 ATP synthase subunit A [Actinomycetota bacterium]